MAQDFANYLNQNLAKLDFDGDLSLNWQKKTRTFTLEMIFYAANPDSQEIVDSDDVVTDADYITFIDEILFFDKQKPVDFNSEDYLACLPFAGKQGWTKQEADGFLAYLQEVLDNGQSDLLDFLNDDTAEEFGLTWDKSRLVSLIAQTADNKIILPYPKF